jgi:hypothetical protein
MNAESEMETEAELEAGSVRWSRRGLRLKLKIRDESFGTKGSEPKIRDRSFGTEDSGLNVRY